MLSVFALQLQVPDKLIGSVLGKAGATLKEIQMQTGARITISKRGEYAPGTQNRCVTCVRIYIYECVRCLVGRMRARGRGQAAPLHLPSSFQLFQCLSHDPHTHSYFHSVVTIEGMHYNVEIARQQVHNKVQHASMNPPPPQY